MTTPPAPPRRWPWRRRLAFAAALFALFYAGLAGSVWRRAARGDALAALHAAADGRVNVWADRSDAPAVRFLRANPAAWDLAVRRGGLPAGLLRTESSTEVVRPFAAEARALAANWGDRPALTDLSVAGPVPAWLLEALPTDPGPRRLALANLADPGPALAAAAGMDRLNILLLTRTRLTAADADRLADIPRLRQLVLGAVRLEGVTPAGLRAALPGVLVTAAGPAPGEWETAAPSDIDWPRVAVWPAPGGGE